MRGVVGRERGPGDSDENVPEVSASMLGETVESAPEECRNYPDTAMLIWLAVEVKLNGTSRMWLLQADWQGRRKSQGMLRVVLKKRGPRCCLTVHRRK